VRPRRHGIPGQIALPGAQPGGDALGRFRIDLVEGGAVERQVKQRGRLAGEIGGGRRADHQQVDSERDGNQRKRRTEDPLDSTQAPGTPAGGIKKNRFLGHIPGMCVFFRARLAKPYRLLGPLQGRRAGLINC